MNNLLKGYRSITKPLLNRFHASSSQSLFSPSNNDSVLTSLDQKQQVSSQSSAGAIPLNKNFQQSRFTPLNSPHPKLDQFLKTINTNNQIASATTSSSSSSSLSSSSSTTSPLNSSTNFNRADISTLPNGIKVISQQTNENACAIGLFIRGGSKFETPENRGVFNVLEKMSYKSSKSETTSELIKKYETISVNASASSASRDIMSMSVEVLRKDVEYILKSFADQITTPVFEAEEFEEVKMNLMRSFEFLLSGPEEFLPELLQKVAYGDSGLGHSNIAEPEEYEKLSVEHLREAMRNYYIGKNIVVSATGIEHRQLVNYVERYFGDIPYSSPQPIIHSDKVDYFGGTRFIEAHPGSDQFYHIAFPGRGLKSTSDSKEIYTGCVLQTLLGGGRDFSTGGPGKGMQSRLNLNVVYRLPHVRMCQASYHIHSNTSLFILSLTTSEGSLKHGLSLMLSEFLSLRRDIPIDELERAKRQQKSMILMNLELRGILCDDMGRQTLSTGVWKSPEEICRGIDSVTKEDIFRFIDQLLLTNPSVVGYVGSEDSAVSAEDFKKLIKSGKF